jgi:hypothetical protein
MWLIGFAKNQIALQGRFCSMFSQLLQLLPRPEFHQAIKKTHAERHARGFTRWGNLSPYSSVIWAEPIPSGKSPEASEAAKAN